MKWGLIFSLTVILMTMVIVSDAPGNDNIPYEPGEKLTFEVKWAFIPAGQAVLEIFPFEMINGKRAYHFVMTANTHEYIDVIYKVRDRIDAYTDEGMTHSILYSKKSDGHSKKEVVVNFHWDKKEAQYMNNGQKRAPISILPGSFDPLSVFYAFRLHDLREARTLERPVTDGKRCIMGRAKIIKKEKITVGRTSYDTYLVELDMEEVGGVFQKTKNAKLQIWITADEDRIPVRIKSELIIGSFIGELISFQKGHLQ